jgi:hypothetical protein
VIDEATHFLQVYEEQHLGQTPTQSGFNFWAIDDRYTQYYDAVHKVLDAIAIDEITPIEALLHLQNIKKRFSEL